ncbi:MULTISPECIES: restriction endonuclease subunit S [unclassified Exiguobacterium]|uniref:restriction endonuclease subunit S n=1 Tax=unclassified Exiguobacterium TaxID=2644629 RepID=UPI001BE770FE|nr:MULTISPECIES: restriction endonuclease subunit S [unclassified Exiguobacterium]
MSRWIEGTISELIQINPTVSLKKGKSYPFVSMDVIEPFYKPVEAHESREFTSGGARFQNQDTLFARITPCLENGKTAQVKNLDGNIGFGSTEFIVLRGKEGISDSDFIYYLFIENNMREKAKQLMVGTSGRQRVDKQQFEEIKIKIPELSTQRKIAQILGDIDKKIEINRKINETLEKIAIAHYRHWFVELGPFRRETFVESESGSIPNGWSIKRVDELGSVITGKTPSTKKTEYYHGETPFIKIPDMHNNTFIVKTETTLSDEGVSIQKNKLLPPLSVCVSCIATPGLVVLTNEYSQTNQQINSIICNEEISPYFTYLFMTEYSESIITLGSGGTATLNLNKGDFSAIKLLVPDNKTMKEFHEVVKDIFDNIRINSIMNYQLANVRDYILPRLLSGEIEVSKAAERVREVFSNEQPEPSV